MALTKISGSILKDPLNLGGEVLIGCSYITDE